MFSIQERIVSTKIITQEGSFILSDVCLQAEVGIYFTLINVSLLFYMFSNKNRLNHKF